MTKNVKESVICDACNKELICNTGMPAVYALELSPIDVNRNTSHTEFCIIVSKPKTIHFCNKKCLVDWANT